jgi:hypothetical protein
MEKHFNNPIPKGDFLILNAFGIVSPESGIILYLIGIILAIN